MRKAVKKQDNLIWLNKCFDDLKWKLMRCADIGIMPSLHEPFGIVALEWMSTETPLIVSGVDGLNDFCEDGFNATVIYPSSSCLIKAIKNHKKDPIMIQNALKTAKSHSWEKVAEKVKKVYLNILNSG